MTRQPNGLARALSVAGAAAGALVTACAADGRERGFASSDAWTARGRAIAETRCAGCHAIAARGESPRSGAPTFGVLRMRFNEITWERAMREIAEGGHDEMPAVQIDGIDARDLRAYIEGLR